MNELVSQVWASLLRNKLRSFLTMFGITWGVTALALMTAMGDGFRQGQRDNWKQIGDNIVLVFGGRTERHGDGQTAGRRVRLYEDDIGAIRAQCRSVARVAGEVKRWEAPVASEFNSGRFVAVGATPEFLEIRNFPVAQGRSLNQADEREGRRVCILGHTVRKQLFEKHPALGQQVRVQGRPYQVVGLMSEKKQNSSYDGWDNDKIIIPASSLRRDCPPDAVVANEGALNAIAYQPVSAAGWKTAQKEVARVLGRIHNFDPDDDGALHVVDYVRLAEIFDKVFYTTELFMAFVAVVTLSLGGVGVMNTMLMTVSERTNEIGLKMALGATRRRILLDFFLEGIFLAVLSGLAGMVIVAVLAALVNLIPKQPFVGGLPIEPRSVIIAMTCLCTVAVASALPPAWRASRLTPVEALHYER